jgi:hypothetical protein
MLELAIHADNAELGRAVLTAAEQRGLGKLMNRYFDQMNPEAGELYQEFRAAPSVRLQKRTSSAGWPMPRPTSPHPTPPTSLRRSAGSRRRGEG